MRFEKVTPSILLRLKAQGYDLLTALSSPFGERAAFRPIRVNDTWGSAGQCTADTMQQHPTVLVIQDMLDNLTGQDTNRVVLID